MDATSVGLESAAFVFSSSAIFVSRVVSADFKFVSLRAWALLCDTAHGRKCPGWIDREGRKDGERVGTTERRRRQLVRMMNTATPFAAVNNATYNSDSTSGDTSDQGGRSPELRKINDQTSQQKMSPMRQSISHDAPHTCRKLVAFAFAAATIVSGTDIFDLLAAMLGWCGWGWARRVNWAW